MVLAQKDDAQGVVVSILRVERRSWWSHDVEGGQFRAGKASPSPNGRQEARGVNRMFDLHPDGARIAFRPALRAPQPVTHVTLIFNFFEELRRLARQGTDVAVMPGQLSHYELVALLGAGGTRGAWSRDGHKLFYLDADGSLTAVRVNASASSFAVGAPTKILSRPYVAGSSTRGFKLRAYDVSPDGTRFLMLKDAAIPKTPPAPLTITIVLNWGMSR